jgi:hypothetical protein
MAVGSDRPWRFCTVTALILALVAGVVLRLIWVADIEYKGDERWTFERTQNVGRTESLPWLGMPTSFELRHPGGTVWVFVGLARLFQVQEPTQLARACQLLNVLAILLLVGFAFWVVPAGQREPWLWAAALVSVNPLAVLLHRKIWPPSIMPAFTMLLLVCWWYRDSRAGALAWGVVGAALGFLYPAGLFLAAGFALWALLFDRARVPWRWWLSGSVVGALPLIPWFWYVSREIGASSLTQRRWTHLVTGTFWTRWLTEPLGISVEYALGDDFADFLRYPLVAGRPTYLVGSLHVLIGVALFVLAWGVARSLWRQRGRWRALWVGRDSATAFTQNACLWGFGLTFTATLLPVHRHYMVITFPLMFLWLARAALAQSRPLAGRLTSGRAFLLTVWTAQLLISVSFLAYVHLNAPSLRGEYGVPYSARAGAALQPPATSMHHE